MERSGPIEVALSTDLRGAPYSFSLWDIHTGAQLVNFKAIDTVVQIWSIYNRKSQDQKLFLPGRPSALITSPCGNYLICGISEMIYIWQLSSGNLLAHTQRHYQTVTVLKITRDGTFLFSGGEDGVVLVWPFADLISHSHNTGSLGISESQVDAGVNEPRFTWQHHSAKVNDIYIANSGLCFTSSNDKTINIYNYTSGKRIHCISGWPACINCLVMNKNETRVFLGAQDGNIYELAISSLSLALINSRECEKKPILSGHKDKVNQLLISIDGTMLISGGNDSTCKIWDIKSGKLLRDIKHQAPLANIITFLVPDSFALTSMTQSQVKQPFLVKPLKRNLQKVCVNTAKSDLFEESIGIKNLTDLYEPRPPQIKEAEPEPKTVTRSLQQNSNNDVVSLKAKLRELYLLSAQKVFHDVASEPLRPYKEFIDVPRQLKKDRPKKRKVM